MVYKVFMESGDYLDIQTGEERNMMSANIAWTPEGENVGWDEFSTEEEAMFFFNLEKKDISLLSLLTSKYDDKRV
jgi:hypothetical protein